METDQKTLIDKMELPSNIDVKIDQLEIKSKYSDLEEDQKKEILDKIKRKSQEKSKQKTKEFNKWQAS